MRDHSSRVVAALGATINSPQIEPERAQALQAAVREAAIALSRQLNYAPSRSGAQVLPLRSA